MAARSTWLGRASYCALFVGLAAAAQAQAPVQFSGEILVRDLDGGTGTGKLYIGATKQRMEFTAFGEVRPTIVDPVDDTQRTISPRQRGYMEQPRGESGGPVRIPRLDPVDPNNPCAGGVFDECRRLGAETVNGIPTIKWEYTNTDGERVTAWIGTRLRFPVKTVADSGATNELRNVVEGPQPANLFAVPTGFAEVGDLGGSGNAIADAMASINPQMMQQALNQAKQMDALNKANPQLPAQAAIWEAGTGYVVNFTITMRASKQGLFREDKMRVQSNISMRYTASVPMNFGTKASPPAIGPAWYILQRAGSGSQQAEAAPVTESLEWEEQISTHYDTGRCDLNFIEPQKYDTTTVIKGRGASSTPLISPTTRGYPQAMFKINGVLTSYDIMASAGSVAQADIVDTARNVDHCANDRVTNETKNSKAAFANLGGLQINLTAVPLPPTPAGLSGMRSVPFKFNGYEGPATVEWTLTPIAAR